MVSPNGALWEVQLCLCCLLPGLTIGERATEAVWSQVRTCWEAVGEQSEAWAPTRQTLSKAPAIMQSPGIWLGSDVFSLNFILFGSARPAQPMKLCQGPLGGIKWKLPACPSLVHTPYLTPPGISRQGDPSYVYLPRTCQVLLVD